jgi:mannose-6-phosphate isomerase-like protein (cupin superfamily)
MMAPDTKEMGIMDNEGACFIGSTSDSAKERGWFFGSFMDEPLLRSDQVEVAWQHIPNVVPQAKERHFHTESVEINIVVSGRIHVAINGTEYDLGTGEFYVIWPFTTVEMLSTDAEAAVIVVRAPSLYDKQVVP